jgi:hypothetical protein
LTKKRQAEIALFAAIILILAALFAFDKKTAHGAEYAQPGAYVAQVQYQISPAYKVPMPCAKYIDEIEKYDWDVGTVVKIMYAESKCSTKAKNLKDSHRSCKGSYSLMQIGCLHYKGENKEDPNENIRIAFRVYQEAGNSFKPWSTYKLVKK